LKGIYLNDNFPNAVFQVATSNVLAAALGERPRTGKPYSNLHGI